VYVGDAAVVEPSGRTFRSGFDLGTRIQMLDWLFVDADFNQTFPKSLDVPEDENKIPLAPVRTAAGGISVKKNHLAAGLRCRHLADRAANETGSVLAEGWTLFDANCTYSPLFKNKKSPLDLHFSIQNLGNTKWKEAQFATESRLKNEIIPVEEIHFTPGTPFFLKGGLTIRF
jgi:hypothetical protein